MQLPCPIAAVIFDMDGLMLDTERLVLAAWQQAAQEHGAVLDEQLLLGMVGLHDRLCRQYLREQLGEQTPVEAIHDRTRELYAKALAEGPPIKPGLIALLDYLETASLPRAVATSTLRRFALGNLERAGLLNRFAHIIAGDDICHPKPAPDVYLQAAAALGVAPALCVVLEDSEPGVRAALAAGMTPIMIPDLKAPSAEVRAFGHHIVACLADAHTLIADALSAAEALR
ncbi:HAD family hydrolase [Parachitinimonas caeni]|uniref:HAD family phosphatase n=1 Tax=Parachitinimonas caeni TaxID=3031301 RepID=A0ABT7E1K4_9NEIS|nr:HAD family phosphatase [Parachitinimonas caeni]MDK2126176.1 HAD family phosphatase [Parachitinimonas caeni]